MEDKNTLGFRKDSQKIDHIWDACSWNKWKIRIHEISPYDYSGKDAFMAWYEVAFWYLTRILGTTIRKYLNCQLSVFVDQLYWAFFVFQNSHNMDQLRNHNHLFSFDDSA